MHTCHCGQPVAVQREEDVPDHSNPSLVLNYCQDCCDVRCDAYPAACTGTYPDVADRY